MRLLTDGQVNLQQHVDSPFLWVEMNNSLIEILLPSLLLYAKTQTTYSHCDNGVETISLRPKNSLNTCTMRYFPALVTFKMSILTTDGLLNPWVSFLVTQKWRIELTASIPTRILLGLCYLLVSKISLNISLMYDYLLACHNSSLVFYAKYINRERNHELILESYSNYLSNMSTKSLSW